MRRIRSAASEGRRGGRVIRTWSALLLVVALRIASAGQLGAQAPADTMMFYKALDLEAAGKYREAAPLFRAALRTSAVVNALLGLERVYAELGWSDSLVVPLDTLIASNPQEETYRTVQLRTLQSLGKDADLRRAFDRWMHDMPNSAAPYREYARLLLQKNQAAAADSVLIRARQVLGTTKDLQLEIAQARAAQGQWVESAQAWRQALFTADYLEQAAAYALAPTPSSARQQIREIFLAPPVEVPSRRALADLEAGWGSPADGWNALKDLPPDSASADAWSEFAKRAEAEERWTIAREALELALHWKRTPELALRAATAALNAGDAAAALRLAPITDGHDDSAVVARSYLPLHARALAALGRPAEAERLVETYDRFLSPGAHNTLTRTIAWGWVRTGNMDRARAALAATGADGDSSDAAGWLALYEGNLKAARGLLRGGTESSPELALALGLIARLKADSAPAIGHAFLALARGDSAGAIAQFVQAADQTPTVRSLLLATAAQVEAARKNDAEAIALWKRIVDSEGETPEAPQAELEWARLLRRNGDIPGAAAHLEHMILTYSHSALVPQARRELELAKSAIPPVA
ncbi:MAG: tetratricopeptide repeat protein [Gemmatimonas sp.]